MREGFPRKGDWTVCRFKEWGLGKKEGVVFLRVGDEISNIFNRILTN